VKVLSSDYDLVVIGTGSAGFSAAITAVEMGARVALIGEGALGGTCVNVGCIPSKALIRTAEAVHQGRAATRFAGISARVEVQDWGLAVSQTQDLVRSLRKAKYEDILPAYDGITYIEGRARIVDGAVMVDDVRIKAEKIIIATGSSSAVPNIPGIENVPYLNSTAALAMEYLPDSLLVVGAGYIGCELAQLFSRAGVRVTLACRSRLLNKGEPEISAALTKYMRDEGISVHDGLSYKEIRKTDTGVVLVAVEGQKDISIAAEKVLLCTGRRPNSDGLNLAEVGVELDAGGGIRVDEQMATTVAGIYAAGDVTGRDPFVYMAAYGAKIAARNAVNGDNMRYANDAMPAVVFTDPQVASVGHTQESATAEGFDVRVSILPLEHLPRALCARDTRGLIKLVADGKTKRLLGAHILAPEGSDSIQTAALAIKQGLSVDDLADMVFPYLTTVEGLKLAAQTFDKDVTKLSCCAG
jgi:mercuric reductase